MRSIKKRLQGEIIIDMSRFIGVIIPVQSIDEVDLQLSLLKTEYPGATHYCYAYLLGDHQEIQKASDDGEPQKTAGIPMLEVLKKNELTNVLAVTIRYFGGKLLGASGLVRAYTKSISSLLKGEIFSYKSSYTYFNLKIGYKEHHLIEPLLQEWAQVLSSVYTDEIELEIKLNTNQYLNFISYVTEKIHQEPKISNTYIKEIYE